MRIDWRKTLKVATGATLVGTGLFRLFQLKERRNVDDSLAWAMIGFGASHLLQELLQLTEGAWNERQERLQKSRNRFYPVL